jgi:hypothetical protein
MRAGVELEVKQTVRQSEHAVAAPDRGVATTARPRRAPDAFHAEAGAEAAGT